MKMMRKIYAKFITATWKNLKLIYFLQNYLSLYCPKQVYQKQLEKELQKTASYDATYIANRVNYYHRNEDSFILSTGESLANFKYRSYCKNYFFDTYRFTKYFPDSNKIKYAFGDITESFSEPTIVKSRPVNEGDENSVLLKLNRIRHFIFVKDTRKFKSKKFGLLWRGNIQASQMNRVDLLQNFHKHPLCDVGYVNDYDEFAEGKTEKMTLYEQLEYQFILSLEGNDVATNLKWIMSSNSIAVMPKPKYETWFMEGILIPDYHYILVKDDFSDLIEKITYYHNHPDEAKQIIRNANEYVTQFKNKKREKLISLLVLQKYFDLQK